MAPLDSVNIVAYVSLKQNTMNMHVVCKGQDFYKYDVAIKQIFKAEGEDDKALLAKLHGSKWIPLKVENSRGGEIWVKVNRNDLKERFHITENELRHVQNPEKLLDLIKAKVQKSLYDNEKLAANLNSLKDKLASPEALKFPDLLTELKNYVDECVDEEISEPLTILLKDIENSAKLKFENIENENHFYSSPVEEANREFRNDAFAKIHLFENLISKQIPSNEVFQAARQDLNSVLIKELKPLGGKQLVKMIANSEFNAENLQNLNIENLPEIKEKILEIGSLLQSNPEYSVDEKKYLKGQVESLISSVDLSLNRKDRELRERLIEEAKDKVVNKYSPSINSELSRNDLKSILNILSKPVLDDNQLKKFSTNQLEEVRPLISKKINMEIRAWQLTSGKGDLEFLKSPITQMEDRLDAVLENRVNEAAAPATTEKVDASDTKSKLTKKDKTKSFFKNLLKYVAINFVVQPLCRNIVKEAIANKTSDQLSEFYIHKSDDLKAEIRNSLMIKNKSLLTIVDEKSLGKIIDVIFIIEAKKQLSESKEDRWDNKKIQKLNTSRVVNNIISNPSKLESYSQLEKVDPLKIPFSELALIPVTEENLAALTDIWKVSVGNLYAKGRLDALIFESDNRGIIIQSQYAGQYLQVYHSMPWMIKANLSGFLEDLNKAGHLDKISDFVIQHSGNVGDVNYTDSSLQKLQAEQKVYYEKVYPNLVKIFESEKDAVDASNLIQFYNQFDEDFSNRPSHYIDNFFKLTPEEEELFDIRRLQDFVAHEIESKLVLEYHFTSTQINSMIKLREDRNQIIDDLFDFHDELEDIETLEDLFKLLRFDELYNGINLEQIAPSNFPPISIKNEIKPLEDLEHVCAIKRLVFGQKKMQSLLLATPQAKNRQDVKYFAHVLNEQVNAGMDYMESIVDRNKIHMSASHGKGFSDELLMNPSSFEEVENGHNLPILQPQEQIGLMNLQKLLNKNKINEALKRNDTIDDMMELSSTEVFESSNFLNSVSKNSSFNKVLNRFSAPKESSNLDPYLQYLPTFINTKIKQWMSTDENEEVYKLPAGITKDTIDFVKDYNYKIGKMDRMGPELVEVHKKADALLLKYKQNPSSIQPEDRLTLHEIGLLSAAERLNAKGVYGVNFVGTLKGLGLYYQNAKIKDFEEKSEKSAALLRQIDEIVTPAIHKHYQPGEVVAYSNTKTLEWKNKPPELEVKLTAKITNDYTHGAKLYRNTEGEIMTSHIIGTMTNDAFDLYKMCISDIYEMNLGPLLPKSIESTMKSIYGDTWNEDINKRYREIENDFQIKAEATNKFGNVKNEQERRILAGVANYAPVVNIVSPHKVKGHTREFDHDLNKLHSKFFDSVQHEEKQICSEFVSKVTVVSLIELNREIAQLILEKKGDRFDNPLILERLQHEGVKIPEDVANYARGKRDYESSITADAEKKWVNILKANGYSADDAELVIRIGNKEILDLPYSKKERFKAIHPGRMVSLLVDKKCATKKQLPPEVSKIFAIDKDPVKISKRSSAANV